MDRNEKLSEHFTLGELLRSETAERKGIDNNPPQDLIPKLKRICEKVLEPIRKYSEGLIA
jgi:zinc D-Ala-D-Ala carboxypeptidase